MPNSSLPDGCLEDLPADAEQPKIIIHVAMGMVALLSVCGIIGNALVIFVFSRQKHKLSSTVFILTLAVTDFISSLVTMPYTVVMELMEYNIGYDFPCKLYQFMKTTTIPFSAFVMVAIALDRYLCIVYPFKHIMTIKRAKVTVTMLALLAFVIGIMCSLMIGTYHVSQPKAQECIIRDSNHNSSNVLRYADEKGANISMAYVSFLNDLKESEAKTGAPEPPVKSGDIVHGLCGVTTVILTKEFIYTYQKIYSSLFGICAVAVVILYCLTYRSVLAHRRKRLNISNRCCGILSKGDHDDCGSEHTEFSTLHVEKISNGNGTENIRLQDKYDENSVTDTPVKEAVNKSGRKKSEYDTHARPGGVSRAKLKKLRVANIKTALMLSIVAFLFIVAFTPAWMMALHVLSMNVIVYYLYFTYNVANPVIYAFLNNSFRTHLQQMFRCKQ